MKNDKNESDPRMDDHERHDGGQPVEQAQHERLCAYLFGELQGPERAAFEVELQRSPALRAEHERLAATIGLVQRAIPDEGLSMAMRRDVFASARRSRFRFLGGRSVARLVAAVVVLAGAALTLRYVAFREDSRAPGILDGTRTARAPQPDTFVQRGIENESRAKAVVGGAIEEAQADIGHAGGSQPEGPRKNELAKAAPQQEAGLSHDDASQLRALGYGGNDGTGELQDFAMSFEQTATEQAPPARMDAVDSFLGQGEKKQAAEAEVRLAGLAATQSPGGAQYRGPSDSGPPSSVSAPSRESRYAPAGPASPSITLDTLASRITGPKTQAALRSRATESLRDIGYADTESDLAEDDKESLGRVQLGVRRTREQVVAQVEELLGATRIAPGESPRDMFFRYWGDAPFVPTLEEGTSTFAVDVDTASYALMRAYLNQGELPPREAVRTEEFVNYFKADQAPPTDGQPFAIGLELAPSLFSQDARTEMLRVTVRGKDVADFERQPVALTFVIDNSGSMASGGRLELVKRSLGLLLRQLGAGDSVAVVKFSNSAAQVAPMTPATRRGELEGLIQGLGTEGGTNVEAGLRLGYEIALENLQQRGVNRVILCSDGVGNIGETSAQSLVALVRGAREKGIYLNTVGVGIGNHNDVFLEQFADQGDGVCNYVDSEAEAKRVFVDNLASALQPIARDVKIQVEFDPAQVESWRLLGYENRALRTQDFRNDKIDAGEVNAGHQVTALYELVRRPSQSRPLASVRLRYKPPFAIDAGNAGERARVEAEQALEIERPLLAAAVLPGFRSGSNGYQRAVLVAQFAEVLRQSVHTRGDSLARLLEESRRLEKALGDPDFTEFVQLLGKANPLLDARTRQETPHVQQMLDELGELHYEEALRLRKLDLARQAGDAGIGSDEEAEEDRKGQSTKDRILELEAEVRSELLQVNGFDPAAPNPLEKLEGLGYVR